jgi:hypothetical protein
VVPRGHQLACGRRQLEWLPGVKRCNEPLGKQAIGTGPLVSSPNTRPPLSFLFSYFPFIFFLVGK